MSASLLPARADDERVTLSIEHSLGMKDSSLFRCERVSAWIRTFEWIAVAVVGCVSVALHLRFVFTVGGLWRDEANTVGVATLPSFGEMAHFLDYDSFPILFFALLRGWLGIFGAENDAALRTLGCLTGLGILFALWLNARAFGARVPVLSFAFVGLNTMIIRYGDSTRAYGLGIFLILLTLRAFWLLVRMPASLTPKRIGLATLLALLGVQCLYYNSVLLLAIAAGAITVAATRKDWRTVGVILGIGIVAALSLLPYIPMVLRMREWTFLVSYPADFAWLWERVQEVIGFPDPIGTWFWAGGFVIALLCAGVYGVSHFRPASKTPSASLVFAVVTLVIGVAGYASFLNVLNYYTQPWYYITIAVFVACLLDAVFGSCSAIEDASVSGILLKGFRLSVSLTLLVLAAHPCWKELSTRHTNIDLLAARLRISTREGDLVLVASWENAITLCRYYPGPADIVTLPPIEDHRFHRYDLVLRAMMTTDAARPALQKMESTLRSAHRVFILGDLPFPESDAVPPMTSLLHRNANGEWEGENALWAFQAGQLLRAHAATGSRIEVPEPKEEDVQEFEHLRLAVAEGWR